MTFAECIDLAIASNKIKAAKGQEAKDAYDAAYQDAMSRGASERAADDVAAVAAVTKLGTRVQAKKWLKINEIRVSADLYNTFRNTARPEQELYRLSFNLDASTLSTVKEAHSMIADLIEKYMPRGAGAWHPVKDLDEIIRANFGGKVSPESKVIHDQVVKVRDFLRTRKNMEGVNVHPDPEGRIPLMQDGRKIAWYASAVKRGPVNAKADWITEHLEGGDWERIVDKKGEPIAELFREDFLSKLYDDIRSRGALNRPPTSQFEIALAERLSHPDWFYYKDADTWLAMNEKYGSGNVYQQVMMNIEQAGKDISLLKNLGPHPLTQLNFIKNISGTRAAELDKALPTTRLQQSTFGYKASKEFDSLEHQYSIQAGDVAASESVTAIGLATAKNLVSPGILPFAFFSNLNDVVQMWRVLRLNKLPAARIFPKMLKEFAMMPSKTRRREALRNMAGMQSALTTMARTQKNSGVVGDGLRWSNRYSDFFFRGSFMVPLQEAERRSFIGHMDSVFADAKDVAFEDLPWADSLTEFKITKEDWDIFRQTPIFEPDGQHLLRPGDAYGRKDLDPVAARRLGEKFADYTNNLALRAGTDLPTRNLVSLGKHLDPNSWVGISGNIVGFIKSYTTMAFMTYMKEEMMHPGVTGKAGAIARYMLVMTLGGAMITQMKELANGRDPANMEDPNFWIRSLLNGGSLGFLGDAVFGSLGAYKHGGFAELMTGPLPQFFDSVWNMTVDDSVDYFHTAGTQGLAAANGKYKGVKDLGAFVERYNPVPWQFRLIMQRTILDDYLRQANPTAFNSLKRQQTQRENNGQQSYWGVGDKSPRLPNLGAAFGGSKR